MIWKPEQKYEARDGGWTTAKHKQTIIQAGIGNKHANVKGNLSIMSKMGKQSREMACDYLSHVTSFTKPDGNFPVIQKPEVENFEGGPQ